MTGTLLDAYTLRARVFPAVLALAPVLILGVGITDWTKLGLPHAVGALGFGVSLFALADFARRRGRAIEDRVYAEMGGKPSVSMLRHRDVTLDRDTKARIHGFLGGTAGVAMPTERDEVERPTACDNIYEQCGRWLRENTRDAKVFRVLKDENITYGYRRNLLGLKWIAVAVGVGTFLAAVGLLVWFPGMTSGDEQLFLLSMVAIAFAHVTYFVLAVTRVSVQDAARHYGRQLLLCCETIRNHGRVV